MSNQDRYQIETFDDGTHYAIPLDRTGDLNLITTQDCGSYVATKETTRNEKRVGVFVDVYC
jgi:hypothetical protein